MQSVPARCDYRAGGWGRNKDAVASRGDVECPLSYCCLCNEANTPFTIVAGGASCVNGGGCFGAERKCGAWCLPGEAKRVY